MRISDWSSDVCSSDLQHRGEGHPQRQPDDLQQVGVARHNEGKGLAERGPEVLHRVDLLPLALHANDYSIIFSHTLKIKHIKTPNRNPLRSTLISRSGNSAALPPFDWGWQRSIGGGAAVCPAIRRSEEHTSALQSLMRISSAVFFLKNKK